jgi:hypothetical protein
VGDLDEYEGLGQEGVHGIPSSGRSGSGTKAGHAPHRTWWKVMTCVFMDHCAKEEIKQHFMAPYTP